MGGWVGDAGSWKKGKGERENAHVSCYSNCISSYILVLVISHISPYRYTVERGRGETDRDTEKETERGIERDREVKLGAVIFFYVGTFIALVILC